MVKKFIVEDDENKICMFCQKEIDEQNERYCLLEEYDCRQLILRQWAHVNCREKMFEIKAMGRVERKVKSLLPAMLPKVAGVLG